MVMQRFWVLVFAVLVMVGCAQTPTKIVPQPPMTFTAEAYVLGEGDQIIIDVWRSPELSRTLAVRPDGKITMPLMGDIQAAGVQPSVLADTIAQALTAVVRSPEVTVTVQSPVSKQYVYRVRILGEVNNPTAIAYVEGMTVVDAMLAAGGVSPFGAANRVVLTRQTEQGPKEYPVLFEDILQKGDLRTNYLLQPTDVLTVPQKSLWRGEF